MENFNIDIIKAFNCSGKPEKLDGGQRQSYKVGDVDALFYKDNYDLFFEDFSRFEPLIEKLL